MTSHHINMIKILNTSVVYDPTTDLWSYDSNTGTFTSIVPMTQPRFNHRPIACKNKICIFGGSIDSSCECYDIKKKIWMPIANMPKPISEFLVILLDDDNIAILGGTLPSVKYDFTSLDCVYLYNVASNKWSTNKWKLPVGMRCGYNGCTIHVSQFTRQLVVASSQPNGCWVRSLDNNEDEWIFIGHPHLGHNSCSGC